ncbi:hypothetical protein L208DRAFT_1376731 [Tricholoma matsutake]|nr:hypothetical protein L208DRAFT_1376731 [Tricholoma matsutake 945]
MDSPIFPFLLRRTQSNDGSDDEPGDDFDILYQPLAGPAAGTRSRLQGSVTQSGGATSDSTQTNGTQESRDGGAPQCPAAPVASGVNTASVTSGIHQPNPTELPPFQVYKIWYTKCEMQCNKAWEQCYKVATHAMLTAQHVKSLQSKLNSKAAKKTSSHNVIVTGGIVTTQEGHRIAAEQRAAHIEKEKKVEESLQKKKDMEAENHVQRLREGKTEIIFEGLLAGQKLPSLHDIVWALRLAETGTCKILIIQINDHFNLDENSTLKEDPCYIGLFGCPAQRWKAIDGPSHVEPAINVEPPSATSDNWQQRVRLHEHTNFTEAGPSMPQVPVMTYFPHFPQLVWSASSLSSIYTTGTSLASLDMSTK